MKDIKTVLGEDLQLCSVAPKTGFFRTGTCETAPRDLGSHVVYALATKNF